MASYPATSRAESKERKCSRHIDLLSALVGAIVGWAVKRLFDELEKRVVPVIWHKIKQEHVYATIMLWTISCIIYTFSLFRIFTGDQIGGFPLAILALLPLICTRWIRD